MWFVFFEITGEKKQRVYASVPFAPRLSKAGHGFIWSFMKLDMRDKSMIVEPLTNHCLA